MRPAAKIDNVADQFMKMRDYDPERHDVTGWLMSEKLDGLRARWLPDVQELVSSSGIPFDIPMGVRWQMPKFVADGELYMGREQFDECSGIVRTNEPCCGQWVAVAFHLYDMPQHPGTFQRRYRALQQWIYSRPLANIAVIEQLPCLDATEMKKYHRCMVEDDPLIGEGVVLHKPDAMYQPGVESHDWLRYCPEHEMVAVVTGYSPGTGRNTGVVGSLDCVDGQGRVFNVGSGLTDARRADPPPVGATIRLAYKNLTKAGLPRQPRYQREV